MSDHLVGAIQEQKIADITYLVFVTRGQTTVPLCLFTEYMAAERFVARLRMLPTRIAVTLHIQEVPLVDLNAVDIFTETFGRRAITFGEIPIGKA